MEDTPPKNDSSIDLEKMSPISSREAEKDLTDVELSRSQSAYKSINCTYGDHLTVERTRSRIPLDRNWSLNDGFCLSRVDNDDDDVEDEKDNQDKATAPETDALIVSWDENDPMNPRNLGYARKWLIVLIVSLGSACCTCTSSMYTMTYGQITEEFHCSHLIATLGLTTYIFGLGIGPLFLGPLSEFYGRRIIYIVSFAIFLIWLIPCAVAPNIQTMIVARFFNGLSGSAFLSVAGGTVGDLFHRNELGGPMMFYTASPFIGPEIGPLAAGFINEYASWHWTFYSLMIWSGALLASIVLLVPETYHPIILKWKAAQLRKETGNERYIAPIELTKRSVMYTILHSIYRPMLLLALEPMCLNLCIFSAILLGILYLFFGAFQLVYSNVYGFSLWQIGCSFLGLLVGMIVAILTDPFWRRNYARLRRNHEQTAAEKGEYMPEWRLPPAIAGAPLVTIGLFIFAWTINPRVHWIGTIIGSGIFAAGTVLVYSGIFTFLVDAYPAYAASALAANSFARSSFAGVFPLFGVQMYNRLGYQWATSLLAFLTLAMLPFPYIFFRFGSRIRKKSRFAAYDT
ncbi:Major facilitator superfamily domain containing protein [Elaphomyces granulatus]